MPADPPPENPSLDSEETAWLAQYYTNSKTHDTVEADENPEGDPAHVSAQLFPVSTQKYRLGEEVGSGGMKSVHRAHDLNANRDVAMAKLREASAPPRRMRRFVREARITAALEHPNIVPVHEIGVDETGKPYFTMKLLGGETLHSVLKKLSSGDAAFQKKYTLARLLQIFQSVCNAAAFAHSRGIIHLDLKPSNIQVGDFGEVLVLDWGLAKMMEQS
ncbi:MAG: serine/threonine-protein kinase, partial [Verrucomicrobiota bacterium]